MTEARPLQVDGGGGHTAFKLHAAPDRLELLLPCVLFGVRSQQEPMMAEVAMNLEFAPRLHAAAKRITGRVYFLNVSFSTILPPKGVEPEVTIYLDFAPHLHAAAKRVTVGC